jgi:hypothetical protein
LKIQQSVVQGRCEKHIVSPKSFVKDGFSQTVLTIVQGEVEGVT